MCASEALDTSCCRATHAPLPLRIAGCYVTWCMPCAYGTLLKRMPEGSATCAGNGVGACCLYSVTALLSVFLGCPSGWLMCVLRDGDSKMKSKVLHADARLPASQRLRLHDRPAVRRLHGAVVL